MKSHRFLIALGAVLGLATGAGAYHLLERALAPPAPALAKPIELDAGGAVPERRPEFTLPDLEGEPHHVSEWDGRVLVVNFWATWCAPCRYEIPLFIDLQERYAERGLQFVGIAIDDVDSVRAFHEELGINYPSLHGQLEAIEVSKRYGNVTGGLPYTVVVDRAGKIVAHKSGPFEQAEIEATVLRHL